ncbi:RICIN domain-containing protein [Pseudoalteromonas sp. BZB3]|uniref:RICIN domain-containing protein n=1 Tax=Pseudoalteromonas sp. BZB3 TaxID=3136670 RepID=UPI0032C40F54
MSKKLICKLLPLTLMSLSVLSLTSANAFTEEQQINDPIEELENRYQAYAYNKMRYNAGIMFLSHKKLFSNDTDKHICIDGERSTNVASKRQNVQAYKCDFGADQMFIIYKNGRPINFDTQNNPFGSIWGDFYGYQINSLYRLSSYIEDMYPNDPWVEIRPTLSLDQIPLDVFESGVQLHPSLCLDVAGYNGNARDNVTYFTCQNLDDQKWKLKSNGEIVNKKKGMCLDISGYSGASNKNIGIYHCEDEPDQKWAFTFYNMRSN